CARVECSRGVCYGSEYFELW
nr:immunoglobulin heavy chain junction region [Macaca mulatta]MOW19910.1 immunoglobulin heavy chain junction region [Macaca mulatta]MOW20730.1 immunoglobulin heavy chain junction region [Macaca mulatta]MOW21030.1 immunoglobulin heavy chain junction region [Macaca mulatta]MOW21032.1 immunoglobulin heavy chain junction region [Macaca mulatta]